MNDDSVRFLNCTRRTVAALSSACLIVQGVTVCTNNQGVREKLKEKGGFQ